MTAAALVEQYQLLPHPEGGYYKETYRSKEILPATHLSANFQGERHIATAIYFLLEQGNFSAFHRIQSDECWHFYAGQPLLVHVIDHDGNLTTTRLGNDAAQNETFQYVVPAGCWFASECAPGSSFSFVGCTVSPGFDFRDFELADGAALAALYPQYATIVQRLCR